MTEACRICPGRLVDEAARLFGSSLGDLVPPEAQRHLLNAQRELLLAVVVTIDYHSARGATRAEPHDGDPESPDAQPGRQTRRRAPRSSKPAHVELE